MKERNHTFSYLRVIAALAIVFLHVFQYSVEAFQIMGTDKIASMCVRNLTLWAVPIFVLVSGALLLDPDREMTYKKLYIKYILKIVITLFLAVIIYEVVDSIIFDKVVNLDAFIRWMKAFYTGNSWKPLWYLYMLIALYVMLPIYRRAAAGMNKADFRYVVGALFVFQSFLPFIEKTTGVKSGFYICVYAVYTLYFYAGFAIYKGYVVIKNRTAVPLLILSSIANVLLTILSFKKGLNALYSSINNYSSVIVVLQSLSLFAIFMNCREIKEKAGENKTEQKSADKKDKIGVIKKLILSIDQVTLGIYLVHLVLLRIVIYSYGFNPYKYGMYMTILLSIALFIVSYIISRVLHLIPLINKII